jgi:hypothetical protein
MQEQDHTARGLAIITWNVHSFTGSGFPTKDFVCQLQHLSSVAERLRKEKAVEIAVLALNEATHPSRCDRTFLPPIHSEPRRVQPEDDEQNDEGNNPTSINPPLNSQANPGIAIQVQTKDNRKKTGAPFFIKNCLF